MSEEALAAFNDAAPKAVKYTERDFARAWVTILSRAMLLSGKGFRMDSPKRRPPQGASRWRGERRADKVGMSKTARGLLSGVA